MILVDTGAFYALHAKSDQFHAEATRWLRENNELLITTNLIVAETLTLLRARRHATQALAFSKRIKTSAPIRIEWIDEADFQKAWDLFDQFDDKEWSFFDCTTRVVMQRLGIRSAFSFDRHFRQFGDVTVVP